MPWAPRTVRVRRRTQQCAYCERPATLRCDFRLGYPAVGYHGDANGNERRGIGSPLAFTCNMPLCPAHAQRRGMTHIKAKLSSGAFDTIDYCPEHRDLSDCNAVAITDEDARAQRRALLGIARRGDGEIF